MAMIVIWSVMSSHVIFFLSLRSPGTQAAETVVG